MDKFINNIKNVVPMHTLIYIVAAIVIVIISTIMMMMIRKKHARKRLEELEVQYNSLKGIPLAFKLNKAVALSRVNEEMAQQVENCKSDFDSIQEKLKECSVQLAEADDLIYVHKTTAAKKKMLALVNAIRYCEENANQVNDALDQILEQENEQRIHINKLKEKFRAVKRSIHENKANFSQSYEYLELEVVNIEKMFSLFEEWMFASEFSKAADQQQEIKEAITHINDLVEVLPSLYERAKVALPRAIDEVGFTYAQVKNKGVYLEHIEVYKNLDAISEMLKNDLNKMRNGTMKNVHEDLNECEKRTAQLSDLIEKEEKAFDEVDENIDILFDTVKGINADIDAIEELYNRVYERFGFENWTEKLNILKDKLAVLNDMQRKLNKVVHEQCVPYTTILIAYKEVEQSTISFTNEVIDMKSKLNNACSDEERAKKQLIKLQLIVNEIRVKMCKHRLPSVSQKYEEDIHKSLMIIKEIHVILDNSPLDVKRLNTQLKVAIDYIYTLYNSVNNLVGIAIMVENTIVFGNRYRSSYGTIDSELTRAELCFRNGEYTKALKIGIQCIEKMHPGAYEKLVNKNHNLMNTEG